MIRFGLNGAGEIKIAGAMAANGGVIERLVFTRRKRMDRVYTNKLTGESGTAEYWEKKYMLRPGTMSKRAEEYGEGNPIIFNGSEAFGAIRRKLNYDPELGAARKERRIRAKLEAAGQLRLFA